jgi:hypothetical protein
MTPRVFVVATVFLAALVVHQYRTIKELRSAVGVAAAAAAADARGAVIDAVADRSPDVQHAMAWLNDFYQSREGLQRAHGLCDREGRADYVAIGAWIFDVYLRHRLQGETDDQAREAIVTSIKQSAEWRARHPS